MSAAFRRWCISTGEPDRRTKMSEEEKVVRLLVSVRELESSLKKLAESAKEKSADVHSFAKVLREIENLPTIDPESLRPVSEWELNPDRWTCEWFRCKKCHHVSCCTDAYCGGCGAKMKNAGVKSEDLPVQKQD